MGFYYGSQQTPPDEPHGCRDVLVLSRVVFGVLLVPLAILLGAILGLVLLVYLFGRSWILGLLGLAVVAVGVIVYARWERTHLRGPGGL